MVLPAVLLAITFLTTLFAGYLWHTSFLVGQGKDPADALAQMFSHSWEVLYGLPYCLSILSILLAHEMGHYLACRYYRIQATLPYVIPAPIFFGTFGAVIRIRSPFQDRRQLFDVGIAGPIAGFLVLLPALIYGIQHSTTFVFPETAGETFEFGEPLIFKLAVWLFFPGEDPSAINLHPVGWAAWFGLLATGINLLPIGQLDGGHVVYALWGPRIHRLISLLTFLFLVLISFYSWPLLGYLVFALVLVFLGFQHPPPLDPDTPLERGRMMLALLGLLLLILTFVPVPVRIVEHFGRL